MQCDVVHSDAMHSDVMHSDAMHCDMMHYAHITSTRCMVFLGRVSPVRPRSALTTIDHFAFSQLTARFQPGFMLENQRYEPLNHSDCIGTGRAFTKGWEVENSAP